MVGTPWQAEHLICCGVPGDPASVEIDDVPRAGYYVRQRSPGSMVNTNGSFNSNYITEGTADGRYGDIPGYVTWNLRGGYDFGSQLSNLKLGAGVKNIFDRQYYTRSSDNNSGLYVGAPRTFFVQASVGF